MQTSNYSHTDYKKLPRVYTKSLPTDDLQRLIYLGSPSHRTLEDESILARVGSELWLSPDHGRTFRSLKTNNNNISALCQHNYDDSRAFALASSRGVILLSDRGESNTTFSIPGYRGGSQCDAIELSPHSPNWMIWHTDERCISIHGRLYCMYDAHLSYNNGKSWSSLDTNVARCQFGTQGSPQELILCESPYGEQGQLGLSIKTSDGFDRVFPQNTIPNLVKVSNLLQIYGWGNNGSDVYV